MRPTFLNFRPPWEKTGEYVDPDVTFDGRKLNFAPKSQNKSMATWSQSERFLETTQGHRVTVGPGDYNVENNLYWKTQPGPKICKDNSFQDPKGKYVYVGDRLVREADYIRHGSPLKRTHSRCSKANCACNTINNRVYPPRGPVSHKLIPYVMSSPLANLANIGADTETRATRCTPTRPASSTPGKSTPGKFKPSSATELRPNNMESTLDTTTQFNHTSHKAKVVFTETHIHRHYKLAGQHIIMKKKIQYENDFDDTPLPSGIKLRAKSANKTRRRLNLEPKQAMQQILNEKMLAKLQESMFVDDDDIELV